MGCEKKYTRSLSLVVFAKRRLNIYKVAIVGCDFGGLNNLSRMLCSHRVLNNYKQT